MKHLPSALSDSRPLSIFLLAVGFGFGVPFLFTGPSSDFLGLPLPLFAEEGLELTAAFNGIVVVVVFSIMRFDGESGMLFSGSASTVTRMRQGLAACWALALDFVGDEDPMRPGDGVLR